MGIEVPDYPYFEEESTPYFQECLARASEYLEYGAGGSTVEAARQNKKFTTVESDKSFLEAVRSKIGAEKGSLIHVNIGKTEQWGAPAFKRWTPLRRLRWGRYASAPWKNNIQPDLILIDGRFRVHSTLYCLSQLKGRGFKLLFDDYAGRPFYREVEQFAELQLLKGRMAVFGPKEFEQRAINRAISSYVSDWR